MKIIVTGGAGFIGSQLTQRLAARGDTVTVIDNFDPFYDPNIKRANVAAFPSSVKFIEGDFRDEALVEQFDRACAEQLGEEAGREPIDEHDGERSLSDLDLDLAESDLTTFDPAVLDAAVAPRAIDDGKGGVKTVEQQEADLRDGVAYTPGGSNTIS